MLGRRTGGVARRTRIWKLLIPATVLALGTFGLAAGATAQPAPDAGTGTVRAAVNALNKHDYQRACALAGRGQAACLALVRTNVVPHLQPLSRPATAPTGYGYGPSSLQSAYKLPSSSAAPR
jgi:hypothetical protein